jgi:hypothetical protein
MLAEPRCPAAALAMAGTSGGRKKRRGQPLDPIHLDRFRLSPAEGKPDGFREPFKTPLATRDRQRPSCVRINKPGWRDLEDLGMTSAAFTRHSWSGCIIRDEI